MFPMFGVKKDGEELKKPSFFLHIWIIVRVTEGTIYLYNEKNKKRSPIFTV